MRLFPLRFAALIAAAIALLALPGAVAEAAFPGTNGLIAFERGADIYTVTTDGTNTVSSSPLVAGASDPAWSAHGRMLAFTQGGSIRVLTLADGSISAPLDTGTAPAWSPDGTMITYEKASDIWVMSSSGADARNLSNSGAAADDDPTWSPDGSSIAFSRTELANADIWVMDAPTGPGTGGDNQQRLTAAPTNEIQPNFSPAGTRIAYATDRHDVAKRQIYSIATSGGAETRVTNSTFDDAWPAYSPDGVRIAFARATSGIHTTNGQITSNGTDTNPDWQPTAPTNTALPVISGNAAEGGTLFASTGTFGGSATNFAYQWLRCDPDGNACSDISGATESSYDVVADDVGLRLRVRVTASGTSGSSSAESEPTEVIAGPNPVNVEPPSVFIFGSSDVPVVGATVSSSAGTWTGAGFPTFSYQWKKCMPRLGPCYWIITPAATSSVFVPTGDLIGWSLRIEVTATNSAGSSKAQSEPTEAIIGNPPVNAVRPRVSVSAVSPTVGEDLTVDEGSWTGLFPLLYSYEWRRCDAPGTIASCVAIAGAVTDSYTTTEADFGLTLRVWVTARNAGGAATAISDHTFPTMRPPRLGPSMTRAPALTGEAKLGRTLIATRGTWSGFAPIRYSAVWQRCDAALVVCKAVKSVKGLRYTVTRADLGQRIRLSVVAANSVGSLRARSTATEPIILTAPKPKGRRIVGTNRPNYIPGGGGDDQLFGRGGSDTIVGGAGDDRLDGGPGNDYLDGGKGEDRMSAGPGSDTVLAADGEIDRISCGAGNDRVMADPVDLVDADCEAVTRGGTETETPPDEEEEEEDPDRP